MSYDRGLEARIDEVSEGWDGYAKKSMFGGIAYLKSGNMSFGIWHEYLIVRCDPVRYAKCLEQSHVQKFDITGKPMSGWVMISPEGFEEDSELRRWIRIGDDYASSLPGK